MRIGFLSSMMALLAGVGPALAQVPAAPSAPSAPAASPTPAATGGDASGPLSLATPAAQPAAPPAAVPPAMPPYFGAAPARPVVPPPAPAPGPNGYGIGGVANGDCANGNCAGGACGGGGDPCANLPLIIGNRFYGSAEYILYKVKSSPIPPAQLTIPFTVSGLNLFTSNFAFGGSDVELAGRSGGRFTAGYWFTPDQLCGAEITYFQLERKLDGFGGTQVADLPLNVTVVQNITNVVSVAPLVTAITQVPLNVTLPAELAVSARGSAGPTQFWGLEANARSTRCVIGGMVIDVLGGARFLELDEQFNLNEGIVLSVANPINLAGPGPIPPNPLPPIPPPVTGLRPLATLSTSDQVSTRNRFYGANVGTSADWWVSEKLVLSGWGKFAVGAMIQDISATGFTTTSASPAGGATVTTTTPGGLLTPGTGFLETSRTRYAVIPELNLSVGYQFTPHIRAMVGYNFLYISSLARPGNQIAATQSTTSVAIAGAASTVTVNTPAINYHDEDMWIHGLTAGVQVRW